MKLIFALLLLVCLQGLSVFAQIPVSVNKTYIDLSPFESSARHWYNIPDKKNIINPKINQPQFNDTSYIQIADNMLLYQRNNGGWPKNYDMKAILTSLQKDSLKKTRNILHTTFDNSTTYSHIKYLSKVYSLTNEKKYKNASLKGIDFILSAQYKNGGWPQYYPLEENYSRFITFNDNAMVGIMLLFKEILENRKDYSFINNSYLTKIQFAYNKGLACILKCQIKVNDTLTAWCQQHNEKTLKPEWARKFEPPVISNFESANIVQFLMQIENPDSSIIHSIENAVQWFEKTKIYHTRIKEIYDTINNSNWKIKIVDREACTDTTAPPIWARYYDPVTREPLFCDRNSKYLHSLSEVSRERRAGYGWYTYEPQLVLREYKSWKKKYNTTE